MTSRTSEKKHIKKNLKGNLQDVLSTIKTAYKRGCHIEITTLIVTGINDNIKEMKDIINFIASIDKNIPWHISRYYPNYKYNEESTDIDFIMDVHDEAAKKLNFVYCGNIPSSNKGNDTICPDCGARVISRSGYFTKVMDLEGCKCSKCGSNLNIVN